MRRSLRLPSDRTTVSLLEAAVSMPLKEMGMRPFEDPLRWMGVTVLVDQCPHAFLIVDSPRDQNLQFVRERDQSSIEHPVRRAGKRKTVADDVRAVLLDRPDMSGIDFGATTTVYQPKPGYRTSLVVGPQDCPAEDPVPQDTRGQVADALPGLLEREGRRFFVQAGQRNSLANPGQHRCILPQTQSDDPVEVAHREGADR